MAKIYNCIPALWFGLFSNQVYSAFTGCGLEIFGRGFRPQENIFFLSFQIQNIDQFSRLKLKIIKKIHLINVHFLEYIFLLNVNKSQMPS